MNKTTEYEQLIQDLFSRHQSVQAAGFTPGSYKPGLEAMRRFDAALGAPASRLRCIHVAGTNGKGSVCHMLASALAQAWPAPDRLQSDDLHSTTPRIGLYTSPHLLDFRERIRLISRDAVEMIPQSDVLEFASRYQDFIDREGLSFFEITTGMALWWFDRQGVDIAVMETGLGGRLDSTNIITPDLSIISSIGLDHCAILGSTRAVIAAQKAGIFKPGVPALVWGHDPQTDPVFEDIASKVGAPLYHADEIASQSGPSPISPEELDLHGEYQETNLRTVLSALRMLGIPVSPDVTQAIALTARRTALHGRWETLGTSPLMIADIGHNPPALSHNFSQLGHMMSGGSHDRLIIVYGVMADKDLNGIIPLMPEHASYIFVSPDTPRAMPSGEILRRYLQARPGAEASDGGTVSCGISQALDSATPASLIYIGGSTFVVAEALAACYSPDSRKETNAATSRP